MQPSQMTLESIVNEINERINRTGFYDDQAYDNDLCFVDLLGIMYHVTGITLIRAEKEGEDDQVKLELFEIAGSMYANLEADREWLEEYLLKIRDYCELYNI